MKSIITTKHIFFGIVILAIFVLASACGSDTSAAEKGGTDGPNDYGIYTVHHNGRECIVFVGYEGNGISCDWTE